MDEDNHEEEDQEELTMEDVLEENDIVLNALIDLLIDKGVITEEELNKKLDDMESEMEDSEEDE